MFKDSHIIVSSLLPFAEEIINIRINKPIVIGNKNKVIAWFDLVIKNRLGRAQRGKRRAIWLSNIHTASTSGIKKG